MTVFYSGVEPLSKYSPVMLHLSPASRILNENPAFSYKKNPHEYGHPLIQPNFIAPLVTVSVGFHYIYFALKWIFVLGILVHFYFH